MTSEDGKATAEKAENNSIEPIVLMLRNVFCNAIMPKIGDVVEREAEHLIRGMAESIMEHQDDVGKSPLDPSVADRIAKHYEHARAKHPYFDVPTIDMRMNELSEWEWMTLVGAWRYYQYRNTIASATFPKEIVSRYWGSGRYGKAVQMKIARQFAAVDHRGHGEDDWKSQPECDRVPWAKFLAFCKGVCDGFLQYRVMDGDKVCKGECFRCETTGRLYPVGMYIHDPYTECYLGDGAQICREN